MRTANRGRPLYQLLLRLRLLIVLVVVVRLRLLLLLLPPPPPLLLMTMMPDWVRCAPSRAEQSLLLWGHTGHRPTLVSEPTAIGFLGHSRYIYRSFGPKGTSHTGHNS
eukprot:COSAG02_NODE_664_length_18739_cov_11.071567_2_plen_108_part_00